MARVLVVDPDDDFRDSVLLVLQRAHHDAHACRDALEALPHVEFGVCVLVDAETPALGALLARSGARVIAMRKPMHPADLLAAIADWGR